MYCGLFWNKIPIVWDTIRYFFSIGISLTSCYLSVQKLGDFGASWENRYHKRLIHIGEAGKGNCILALGTLVTYLELMVKLMKTNINILITNKIMQIFKIIYFLVVNQVILI